LSSSSSSCVVVSSVVAVFLHVKLHNQKKQKEPIVRFTQKAKQRKIVSAPWCVGRGRRARPPPLRCRR